MVEYINSTEMKKVFSYFVAHSEDYTQYLNTANSFSLWELCYYCKVYCGNLCSISVITKCFCSEIVHRFLFYLVSQQGNWQLPKSSCAPVQ